MGVLKETIEVIGTVFVYSANRLNYTDISFHTGAESDSNNSQIQYPSLRVFTDNVSITHFEDINDYKKIKFDFECAIYINTKRNSYNVDVNTNEYIADTTTNDESVNLNVETEMLDELLKLLDIFVEELKDKIDVKSDSFLIKSFTKGTNDLVVGYKINFSVIAFNNYNCK